MCKYVFWAQRCAGKCLAHSSGVGRMFAGLLQVSKASPPGQIQPRPFFCKASLIKNGLYILKGLFFKKGDRCGSIYSYRPLMAGVGHLSQYRGRKETL